MACPNLWDLGVYGRLQCASFCGARAHPRSGILSALLISTSSAGAWAPLLDESRGVLTLAPMLEQVTPAVVNIALRLSFSGRRASASQRPVLSQVLRFTRDRTAIGFAIPANMVKAARG